MRLLRVAVACAIVVAPVLTIAAGQSAERPNLSGFWSAGRQIPPDAARVKALPPNTVVLADAGAIEFPAGEFGGLRPKPVALAAAKTWKPEHEMTVDRVCLPPSIVYAMQGPFPMEIHQGADMIVMRLEYYDMVRVIFLDGRAHPPASAPHTKVGHSVGRWDGSTLVVDTTHLSASTITNNGLNHTDDVHVIERFWLGNGGKTLMMLQEFEDSGALDNRGARFVGWDRGTDFIYPYECDPSFATNYQKK